MYFVCPGPDLIWLVVVKGDGTSKNREIDRLLSPLGCEM